MSRRHVQKHQFCCFCGADSSKRGPTPGDTLVLTEEMLAREMEIKPLGPFLNAIGGLPLGMLASLMTVSRIARHQDKMVYVYSSLAGGFIFSFINYEILRSHKRHQTEKNLSGPSG